MIFLADSEGHRKLRAVLYIAEAWRTHFKLSCRNSTSRRWLTDWLTVCVSAAVRLTASQSEGHWSAMPLRGLPRPAMLNNLCGRFFRRSEGRAMLNYLALIQWRGGEKDGHGRVVCMCRGVGVLLTDERGLRDEQPWGEQLHVFAGSIQTSITTWFLAVTINTDLKKKNKFLLRPLYFCFDP